MNDPTPAAAGPPRHLRTEDPTDPVTDGSDTETPVKLERRRPGTHLHPTLAPHPGNDVSADPDLLRTVLAALKRLP
jgi:hypothetical protein